jgi:sterol desaturase/sphingolipid hydroxylase (fatty acid hydroxylase superfamily)
MRLSKAGYYADYVVYPVLLLPLAAVAVVDRTLEERAAWCIALCGGVIAFTLLEYLTHRVLLHGVPPFSGLHDVHHRSPTADIGIPTWLSAAFGGAVFASLYLGAGLNLASGLTAGLILGYLWFGLLHHAVHRWRARDGSYLHRAKRRHSRHHHERQPGNFGVTTAYWDRLFGTTVLDR